MGKKKMALSRLVGYNRTRIRQGKTKILSIELKVPLIKIREKNN